MLEQDLTLLSSACLQYVVQWVLEKGDPADRSLVIAKVFGQLLPLAQQKFASNVVEKCIVYGGEDERARLLDEVLAPTPDGTSVIKAMLVHPYANYVMQSASLSLSLLSLRRRRRHERD